MDNIISQFKLGMDRTILPLQPFLKGLILNVGAGNKQIPGAIPLDWPSWNADRDVIPYDSETVAGIHCYHFLEHCADPIRILAEFQRVLINGGMVNIVVPFYSSSMQSARPRSQGEVLREHLEDVVCESLLHQVQSSMVIRSRH
jgi:predicted SAM-dependent methyltransferase